MRKIILLPVSALGLCAAAPAPAPPAPVSTPVGAYDTTVSGQPILLPQGPVKVTVSRTDLPAHGLIPPHKHPFPRYNYVIAGGVRVTNLDTGAVQEFRAGQFIVETVGQWHKGEALDNQPAALLAIDQAPPGQTNMIRKEP